MRAKSRLVYCFDSIDWIQLGSEPGWFVELSLERDEILPSWAHMTALIQAQANRAGNRVTVHLLFHKKKTRK